MILLLAVVRIWTPIVVQNWMPITRRLPSFSLRVLVFGPERFDDFLLLAVDPAGQDGEQELPRLEDEVHGGSDAAAATSIASGLEDGLPSA